MFAIVCGMCYVLVCPELVKLYSLSFIDCITEKLCIYSEFTNVKVFHTIIHLMTLFGEKKGNIHFFNFKLISYIETKEI